MSTSSVPPPSLLTAPTRAERLKLRRQVRRDLQDFFSESSPRRIQRMVRKTVRLSEKVIDESSDPAALNAGGNPLSPRARIETVKTVWETLNLIAEAKRKASEASEPFRRLAEALKQPTVQIIQVGQVATSPAMRALFGASAPAELNGNSNGHTNGKADSDEANGTDQGSETLPKGNRRL